VDAPAEEAGGVLHPLEPGPAAAALRLTLAAGPITYRVADVPVSFIRAKAETAGWQPFFPQPDAPPLKVADVFSAVPDFLTIAGEGTAPLRAIISIAKLCACSSEVLVAVDEAGRVFVVGCPDETATDPYGSVVADVLAASGRLWRMTYEQFSALLQPALGTTLEEHVMPRARSDWDFDVFRPAVAASLERGRFPVVLVTARPEGQAGEIVGYFRAMNLDAQLAPYAFYESGGVQVLEPAVAGRVSSVRADTSDAARPRAEPPTRPEPARPGQLGPRAEAVFGVKPEPAAPPPAPSSPDATGPAPEPPKPEDPQPTPPAGAARTEPAKHVARPPGPGTKPGVMAGKRPPPKQEQ